MVSRLNLLRIILAAFFSGIVSACSTGDPVPVSEPPVRQYVDQGRAIVKGLGSCGFCHGDKNSPDSVLSGGRPFFDKYGEVYASNLTPSSSGLRGWSTLDIMKIFRTGLGRDERRISVEAHAGFEWMSDNDILAVVAYLKNIPPVDNEVERRSIGIIARNTTGFLESAREVTGYVPDLEKSYQLEYGQYLTDHVARCSSCHNTPSDILNAEQYLGGGAIVKNRAGEKLAPNISSSRTTGIGSWSEEEIVQFLQTGTGPGNRAADPDFCPVDYYSNALPEDQIAIAKYLKSVPAVE